MGRADAAEDAGAGLVAGGSLASSLASAAVAKALETIIAFRKECKTRQLAGSLGELVVSFGGGTNAGGLPQGQILSNAVIFEGKYCVPPINHAQVYEEANRLRGEG